MSFDLAVWEGVRPTSDEAALAEYLRLMDVYQSGEETEEYFPPTAAIERYVEALLSRWSDIDDEGGDDSPWADDPLINNAIGPIIYFSIVWSRADEASAFASDLAAQHRLVRFDPQSETLRP